MIAVTLTGLVSQEPRVIDTKNGEWKLVSVPVSVSKRVQKEGKVEYEKIYVDATKLVKAESAEKFAALFSVGSTVLVAGEPGARAYTDKSGEAKASLTVKISDIEKLGVNEKFLSSVATAKEPKLFTEPEEVEAQDDDLPF